MILINEWLPNPAGPDAEGEWLEFYNGGDSAIFLSGWRVENGGGKSVKIGDLKIDAGGYLVIYRKNTKLVLRNRDERISLYNAEGRIVSQAEFLGSVPEGKSVSRVENGFIVAEPTPGKENVLSGVQIAADPNPAGAPLNRQFASADIIGFSLSLGILISAIAFFAVKSHGHLSQFFFGGDETAGGTAREEGESKALL